MPKHRSERSGIRFLQEDRTGSSRWRGRRWVLVINGSSINATPKQARLLQCLYQHLGRVVSYKHLCRALGYRRFSAAHVHRIRQYVRWINGVFVEHSAPYAVAVVQDFGYALCEVEEDGLGCNSPQERSSPR